MRVTQKHAIMSGGRPKRMGLVQNATHFCRCASPAVSQVHAHSAARQKQNKAAQKPLPHWACWHWGHVCGAIEFLEIARETGGGVGMTPGWIAICSWWCLLASRHLPLSFP